jgi:hypothetical protein
VSGARPTMRALFSSRLTSGTVPRVRTLSRGTVRPLASLPSCRRMSSSTPSSSSSPASSSSSSASSTDDSKAAPPNPYPFASGNTPAGAGGSLQNIDLSQFMAAGAATSGAQAAAPKKRGKHVKLHPVTGLPLSATSSSDSFEDKQLARQLGPDGVFDREFKQMKEAEAAAEASGTKPAPGSGDVLFKEYTRPKIAGAVHLSGGRAEPPHHLFDLGFAEGALRCVSVRLFQ